MKNPNPKPANHHHFDLDSDNEDDSVIHQDSDDDDDADDVEHDDDVDIGFRRHQYATFQDDGNDGANNRKRKQRTKEDAIYGVFMENDFGGSNNKKSRRFDSSSSSAGAAPMFVAAKQTKASTTTPPPPPMFQKATDPTDRSSDPNKPTEQHAPKQELKKEEEEEPSKEDQELAAQQQKADDYFKSLLSKAKQGGGNNSSTKTTSRRRRPASPSRDGEPPSMGFGGMGFGMMPSAFGKPEYPPTPEPAAQKDPSIAKWERHTKGIGFKLLSKMGWQGSGGLGSNRRARKHKITPPNEDGEPAESDERNNPQPSSSPPTTTQDIEQPPQKHKKTETAKAGISKPIEVVVRPANLGLGFGNFKEQSQLKANRQIEAEVRGVAFEDDAKNKKKNRKKDSVHWGPATATSALPSTNELLQQKSWKKLRKLKTNAAKPKIIPYEELLLQQQNRTDGGPSAPVIIDMRGPNHKKDKAMAQEDGKVPLGEELLHNISFLLNTHENKLNSCSHFVKTTKTKVTSLESDLQDMNQRRNQGEERIQKLKKILSIVDQVQALITGNAKSSAQSEVQRLIQELGASFTPDERESLKFWELLAPSLLSPVLQVKLEQWNPLGELEKSKPVIDSMLDINFFSSSSTSRNDQRAMTSLRNSLVQNQLLPRIKQVLDSPKWRPSEDTGAMALDLYEYLYSKAVEVLSEERRNSATYRPTEVDNGSVFPGGSAEDEDGREQLLDVIKKELILDTIHPKLQGALSRWKPTASLRDRNKNEKGILLQLEDRLDLWILPWIPHMDHPGILPNLLSDCKRKLKSSLSYLQRKTDSDIDFCRASMETLKPWRRVYEPQVLQRLVSDTVTPNLARCLAKQRIRSDAADQNWDSLFLTFDIHGLGLISKLEFLSVLEGELLTNWAIKIHELLLSGSKVQEVAKHYRVWKLQTLVKQSRNGAASSCLESSLQLLQRDPHICGIFYSILRMIQLAHTNKMDGLDELQPLRTNYRVASARRAKEKQYQVQEDYVRMESRSASETEARLRLRRRNVQTPTFRDIVEEFALERGILFQPRMGANSLKDGKQLFLFGDILIYMEGDVVYVSKNSEWLPTSLDQIADSATKVS